MSFMEQLSIRDGNFLDTLGCCKVCDGEIPDGHTDNCDIWKREQKVIALTARVAELEAALRKLLAFYDGRYYAMSEHTRVADSARAVLARKP